MTFIIGGYRFNKLPDVKSKKFVSRNCEESYIYTPVFLIRNDKEITLSDRGKSQVRIFNCDCREMKRWIKGWKLENFVACQVVTRKVPNTLMKCLQNVVQKRDRKVEGRRSNSPCCSFNSIEFYSSVQLISLRSPLKSSLSFVAYCFTLRSATNECTYVRFSFTSVPAPLNRPEGDPDSRVAPGSKNWNYRCGSENIHPLEKPQTRIK